jgi:hypothetical protein
MQSLVILLALQIVHFTSVMEQAWFRVIVVPTYDTRPSTGQSKLLRVIPGLSTESIHLIFLQT